jgi:hypothetical protein
MGPRWRDPGGETSRRRHKRAANRARRRRAGDALVSLRRSAALAQALAHPEDVVVEALVRLLAGVAIAASVVVLDLVQAPDRPAEIRAEGAVRAGFEMFVHRVFPSFVHK